MGVVLQNFDYYVAFVWRSCEQLYACTPDTVGPPPPPTPPHPTPPHPWDSALHWQMADERGSWEERGNENRWGWGGEEKQKGTGVNWGNRKGEETYI
ncbi:hypothetical protein EYF80_013124 [Liparis tanakae]|uniref:Uncharacterized protein n=1 Tax=Liparis tanakae TaxID=230148 RepID=A0A4Z2IH60_9TELE|nr:hypothetical protein EYF80_013124 [Liparis tanakae]